MTASCEYDACERGNGTSCIVAAQFGGSHPQTLVWLAKGCQVADREACARLHRLIGCSPGVRRSTWEQRGLGCCSARAPLRVAMSARPRRGGLPCSRAARST